MLKISGSVNIQGILDDPRQKLVEDAVKASNDLYGPDRGTVKIRLTAATGEPEDLKILFTEHRSQCRKQHAISAPMSKEISIDLPSGEYTMQIFARGFQTIRALAEIDPKRPFVVDTALKPHVVKVRSFEEKLEKYGIRPEKAEIGNLTVPKDKTHILNHEHHEEKHGFKMLRANSIAQIKQWVGSDDSRFGHSRPVFGPLPDRNHLARLREKGIDLRNLNSGEVKAVRSIAREYIYGNSRAVALYETLLNEAISLFASETIINIPLFFYLVVTIEAGATLEVGNGSALFSCDELRIHKTGILKPVGDVVIEIGTYTEFQ